MPVETASASAGEVLPFSERTFERLFTDTYRRLWSLARRVSGDEEEAADICQIAYVAVYDYWSKGRLRERPEHLLFRVAKRRAIDVLRQRARANRLWDRLPRDHVVDPTEPNLIDAALRRLPRGEAELLLLQAVVGLTYAELAATEKTTVAAVKSRLFRARRELAKFYRQAGGVL